MINKSLSALGQVHLRRLACFLALLQSLAFISCKIRIASLLVAAFPSSTFAPTFCSSVASHSVSQPS